VNILMNYKSKKQELTTEGAPVASNSRPMPTPSVNI